MKNILLFGAGKSATVLIDYLLKNASSENWKITVVDADIKLAESKTKNSPHAVVVSFDINDANERNKYISNANIVISLLPPTLHILVAESCIELNKNLLTASYIDKATENLRTEIEKRNLLFLCETGLDPGIDHMSAMRMIDGIRETGGEIISFLSHCGGLVAPESDGNPWHYKISWNPKSIVLAGKAGAHFKENNVEKYLKYEELFSNDRWVNIPGLGDLGWYPNRDSVTYAKLYNLENAETFIRTTLRHPDFMYGWKNIIDLKLTDETSLYKTNNKSLSEIFKEHMDKYGLSNWLEEKLTERYSKSKGLLENLMMLAEAEKDAADEGKKIPDSFMTADENGKIGNVDIDEVKNQAVAFLAHNMNESNLTLKQLFYLGLDDKETIVGKGVCSAAEVLQFALEKKLALKPGDKDMIVMMHEIKYKVQNAIHEIKSSLVVKGEDNLRTAMAKTVGLPLGIATKNILNGNIKLKGLHIPVAKEIYEPVLMELEEHGIKFIEKTNLLNEV